MNHLLTWRPVHRITSTQDMLPFEGSVIVRLSPKPHLICHAAGEPVRCGAHRAAQGGGCGGE